MRQRKEMRWSWFIQRFLLSGYSHGTKTSLLHSVFEPVYVPSDNGGSPSVLQYYADHSLILWRSRNSTLMQTVAVFTWTDNTMVPSLLDNKKVRQGNLHVSAEIQTRNLTLDWTDTELSLPWLSVNYLLTDVLLIYPDNDLANIRGKACLDCQ